jgi:DNA (cytosine-5)-methyltransferase 1
LADATSKRGDKRFELESYGRANEAKQNGLGGKFNQLGNAGGSGREELRGNGVVKSQDAAGRCDPGAANGFWQAADWLPCRDGKARPVEPGTFPLAHGVSARVGRLRAYGNAIVPQAAQVFIEAYLET